MRYFYLNGDLHKVLSVTRAQDFVVCWNFPQGKRVGYVWSDVRKNHGKAFRLQQVAEMIGRHYITIKRDILEGRIKAPQRIYAFNENRTPGAYYMSEEDVYALHDYMMTTHIGRPRGDGKVTVRDMPSKAELRAMMKHDLVTYVKTKDGDFVPVWKEQNW
ncbi:hypothetical protein SEA_LIMPID_49 [Streptomyces phage Limpid]|uniref:MerR-like helix-turn-helix DNA binding domain protein n=1 Tax=Streptomyces phage Limpid TaxID=2653770 RepID=A0A5Q2WLJ7_9CAUD|nr:hypothetical protein SEA_LIMPID_49 [Streptomyces phage Limpid]